MPEPDRGPLLHEWLERTARRRPDDPAIVEGERVTTFSQLLAEAHALAAVLSARGLEKGDRVALLMAKSTEAITAVFATLLAGGVYVPIPPRWPAERIDACLRDVSPRFLIAEGDRPEAASAPTITDLAGSREIPWPAGAEGPRGPVRTPPLAPDDPAFVLLTSGSTGRPKGVLISHRAVGAFVAWTARQFRIAPGERLACPSPLSFDLSTFDLFNPALAGATCVIVPESIVWMPRFLVQFAFEQRINSWYSVPSMLAYMLEEGGLERHAYPHLRLILFAGEVLAPSSAARLRAAVPEAELCNLYGPTETNVVTWHPLPREIRPDRPLPIGRPCPYAQVILDPGTREEAGGVAQGELLAAGESLMIGYWNRAKDTRRAFVELPDARGLTTRFYRTGDRVALDPRGEMTFLGRLDRQVKRRGFRIELGEIEAALGGHPEVLEAAAAARSAESVTVISAFVRAKPAAALSEAALKAYCARKLPYYMIPDQIVLVDAMPRGSRGKIDYQALMESLARR